MTVGTFPDELKLLEIWVCWQFDDNDRKRPRAPWLEGHCYPVAWGEDVDRRPETDFETVRKWSQLRPVGINAMGTPFEPDAPRETLEPGLLLPHESTLEGVDRRLVQIDLDDVRDPETGDVHPEAERLVDEIEAYTALSVSGEGIHVFVWSCLPDGYGKFIGELDDEPFADLDSAPQIELYDHGRHVALTGDHVETSPLEIPERPGLLAELIERYPDATEDSGDEKGDDGDRVSDPVSSGINPATSGSSSSPYYDHRLTDFALPADNVDERSSEVQGAHPAHGGTSSKDAKSSNYNIDKRKNQWHCFAHDSGGGPLKMVAVMEGKLGCGDCERGALDRLDGADFLEVCLAARDRGFEGPPPYRALVALADREGLAFDDPDERILGRSAYSVAEQIFKSYSV